MLRIDRQLIKNFDWVMLAAVLLIAIMGLINLYSATYAGGDATIHLFLRQLFFFVAGISFIIIIHLFDYRLLLKWNYPLYFMVVGLLLAALFLGGSIAGTQRWINLGFFRLQPSEPAKLMLVISLASYYYRKDTGHGFTLGELLVPIGLTGLFFVLVLKQPDLGTALMFAGIFISMTLFVKLKWSTIGIIFGTGAAVIPIGWKFFLKPYQRQRIETFLNPESDPTNSGYHIMQSKIAVGSGLKFGKGYLKGTQGHLHFLPERHTDFAFSVWAEEWGFAGSLFFLAVYFFMILWGLNVCLVSRDKFGVLLAFGIVSLIFWQAIINLLMVMGFLPVVGIPLPMFSYGGSSLMTTLIGIGLLMNIRMRRNQVGKDD
ncbi:MAG: rod shape-determining protein RodA [Deltaproteobacteria bacterium]|jgi:rod shape determining protein RodA|nr:rod shape-determining protein RodA [Deltaproteobacteria bacterium]